MILKKLILENFRQFQGRQEVVFSAEDGSNVTVIHGENGFGKTALRNAMLWALYGHKGLSGSLQGKETMIHHGVAARAAATSGDTAAVVKLQFEHQGRRYLVTRSLDLKQQQADPKKTTLELDFTQAGQTYQRRAAHAQEEIDKILPIATGTMLFFDGEGIGRLAMEGSSKEVARAIERMLGLEILKQSIEDLRQQGVLGKLRKELREKTSDEKASLLDELEALEGKLGRTEERLTGTENNLLAWDKEIDAINTNLLASKEVRELQQKRAGLESEITALKARVKELTSELGKVISEDGYTLFAEDLVAKGKAIVADLRAANMIPAPVIDSYLQELLDKGVCICERHLPKDSEAFAAVARRLSNAPNQGFNNAVGQLENAIGIIETARIHARENIDRLNRQRLEAIGQIEAMEAERRAIPAEIGKRDDANAHELEARRGNLSQKKEDALIERGKLRQQCDDLTVEKSELESRIRQLEERENDAMITQRRINLVQDAATLLENILELEKAALRPLLHEEISRHFQSVIDRDYEAKLSDDFELHVVQKINASDSASSEVRVAMSEGQGQVTALTFMGALVSVAKRRAEAQSILRDISGADYPIVMDSPFGTLSHEFRRQIASLIPSLAPQVVIFASASQYDGAVARQLEQSGKIGKRFYLAYHGPSIKKNASPTLVVKGQEYTQYFENPIEFTQIKEIPV